MADNATSAPASGGKTEPTTISLTDPPSSEGDFDAQFTEPAADGGQAQQGAPADKAEPDKDKPGQVDRTVLELLQRGRELSKREKSLGTREQSLKASEADLSEWRSLKQTARANPMAVITRIADLTGLDPDVVTNAYVAAKSGGTPELPADHPLKSEIAELKATIAELKGEHQSQKQKDSEAEGDRLVQGHIDDLKGIASQAADKHPLFNSEPEANAYEAFDLMAARHKAGSPITHAEAVRLIEDTLREDYEKKAQLLGHRKDPTAAPQTRPNTQTQTPATPVPRQAANAAPFEPASQIRSDDEIRADLMRTFGGAA